MNKLLIPILKFYLMKSKWLLTVGMRNSYNEQIILHLEGDNVLALLQSAITRKKTFESFSHEFNIELLNLVPLKDETNK